MLTVRTVLLATALTLIASTLSIANADEDGPSFDCVRALTIDEKVICSSPGLRVEDLAMAQKFKESLERLSPGDQDSLRQTQRDWIRSRNKECGLNREAILMPATQDRLAVCLLKSYRRQHDALDIYPEPLPPESAIASEQAPTSEVEALWADSVRDPAAAAKALRGIDDDTARYYADILEHTLNDDDQAYHAFAQNVLDMTGSHNAPEAISIPCALLAQKPRMLELLRSYHGSTQDNFTPVTDCPEGAGRPELVNRYLDALPESRANVAHDNGCGTMRYAYYKELRVADLRLELLPKTYLGDTAYSTDNPEQIWPDFDTVPNQNVRAWRPSDYLRFNQTELPAFYAARTILTQHYEESFGFSPQDAKLAAHRALWDQISYLGAPEEALPPAPSALIRAIVTGAPVTEVEQLLAAQEAAEGGNYEGQRADLALAAANRPDILRLLIQREYEVNIADDTGRTPLIEASAIGNVDVLDLLKEYGTNPNAATFPRSREEIAAAWSAGSICGGWPDMAATNGHETPLMQAAQFGSLAAIKALLAMGADKTELDSRGFKAVDYLIVRNPALALAKMSEADIKEARSLLK